MDLILNCNVPFCGEVVTLYEPLACYRGHDSNLYAIRPFTRHSLLEYWTRILDSVSFDLEYFASRCRKWGILSSNIARNRSIWALECRLIADKLASDKVRLRQRLVVAACLPYPVSGATSLYRSEVANIEPDYRCRVVDQCHPQGTILGSPSSTLP
jgi:hypothetical protein